MLIQSSLLAIPAFDRIAGLCNRHLNSDRGYVYANDFEVRLRALTDLAKAQRLGGPGLIMGGINFAWLALWVLSPDWLCRKLGGMRFFFRRLGEAAAPGGECGPCPDFASYTLAFALKLRKITENLSQCNRKALG